MQVSALLYCEPLRLVMSASNDESTALIVGEVYTTGEGFHGLSHSPVLVLVLMNSHCICFYCLLPSLRL